MQKSTSYVILKIMNVYFAIAICFVPLLLCFFGFKIFAKARISIELLASFLGLIAVLPITFMQFWLGEAVGQNSFMSASALTRIFFEVLLFNGILEEGLKMVLILFLPTKKSNLKEFFCASLLCGLCLGCFESVVYLLQNLQQNNVRGGEFLWGLLFARMFTSDLIHMFCTGLSGLFIWGIRNKKIDFFSIIFAILAHSLFDFFVYFKNGIHWFAIAPLLLAVIECRIRYSKQILVQNISNQNISKTSKNKKKTVVDK